MNFKGWEKVSLVEWPDKICSIVFVGECNFYCPWCYNQGLARWPENLADIKEEDVLVYLKENQKFLDGVMISGGEPLKIDKSWQKDLLKFIQSVRDLGLATGVETNGSNPEFLEYLLKNKLLDYVAMDVKAPISSKFSKNFDTKLSVPPNPPAGGEGGLPIGARSPNNKAVFKNKYSELAGTEVDLNKIKKSISLIKELAPDYEFRTTVVPGLLEIEDIYQIAEELQGAKRYYLQEFEGRAVENWPCQAYLKGVAQDLEKKFQGYFGTFKVRA